MPTPILFIDFETTGLCPVRNAPISIAARWLGGPHHDKCFHERMRPFPNAQVIPQALLVNGYDAQDIQQWPCPQDKAKMFVSWLFDTTAEGALVQPGGYNYHFDEKFLRSWINRYASDPAYYGNTFEPECVEVMKHLKAVFPQWRTQFLNMKLVTQYEHHFTTSFTDAHNEMADVLATRRLFLLCDSMGKRDYEQYYDTLLHPQTT